MKTDEVNRALIRGAQRSWEACSARDEPPLHLLVWRRWKWWLVAGGLLLLELLVGHAIGGAWGV